MLLVALGIDADGTKHVLGVREGDTENAAACTALLADLRERGLRTDRPTLVVIDGSKALAKAVRNGFGESAIVQRCQAYKMRNVLDQLPDEMKPSVRQALRDAYAANDADRARTMLTNLVRRLRNACARRSSRSSTTSGRSPRVCGWPRRYAMASRCSPRPRRTSSSRSPRHAGSSGTRRHRWRSRRRSRASPTTMRTGTTTRMRHRRRSIV